MPRDTSARDELRRERPAGRRHFGAAWLGGEDRLIHRERPRLAHVAVSNRKPVSIQICRQRLGKLQRRDPQPRGATRSTSTNGYGASNVALSTAREAASVMPARASWNGIDAAALRALASRRSRSHRATAWKDEARTARRGRPRPSRAAFNVPLVLTTSTSPADSQRGRSLNRACSIESPSTRPTRAVAPRRASGRAPPAVRAASSCAGQSEVRDHAGCSHRASSCCATNRCR